ncbi:MAG: c-type cytochrome [Fibrobacteria bacterium]|nr:c-type cytochrome [Fibrobacteria bacterium]
MNTKFLSSLQRIFGAACLIAFSGTLWAEDEVKPLNPAALIRGEILYDGACAGCHGQSGRGDGVSGQYLNPRPRDLTKGIYKFRSTPSGELPTNDDVFRVIQKGIPRTMMPGFETMMTEQEMWDIVEYTKSFSPDFVEYGSGEPFYIPPSVEATPSSIEEGKSLFMVLACWTCHGAKGLGDGPSAPTLKDYAGLPIEAFDFTQGVYKGGERLEDVYRTLMGGLDGTPMAAYANALLFEGGNVNNPDNYNKVYSPIEIDVLKKFMAKQPSEFDINSMSESGKQELIQRRAWSLVHYVKSLSRHTGIFYWLFGFDTEITQ